MAAPRRPQAFELQRKGAQVHQYNAYENADHQRPPPLPARTRKSIIGAPDMSDVKKSTVKHNGLDYQLIAAEIEKDPELGLIIGQLETDDWIFIDEVLPNGMIDMHGILKEGDYLIQAGVYSLVGIDMATALILIERAYDEGKKSITFVAARQEKSKPANGHATAPPETKQAPPSRDRPASRATSFVEYEEQNAEKDFSGNPNDEEDTRF